MTEQIKDEGALCVALEAVWPGCNPVLLSKWTGKPLGSGAVVSGEATNAKNYPIGPYLYLDDEAYDGYTLIEFEKWCEARGCHVEVYEPGTLWVVPLPEKEPEQAT